MRNKFPELGLNAVVKDYPNYSAWFDRLVSRPAVAEVIRVNKEHVEAAAKAAGK